MPLLRRIIFYLFVAIYLAVCPLLILRMLGFNQDPQTHKLVKTGIIYVSSNPPDARVYVNDTKAHEHTPTIIRDLLPDNYKIRLELDGYQTWENTVAIVHRKATVLENILLIPQKWAIKSLINLNLNNILVLGDGNVLLAWQEKTIKGLYLLHLNKDSSDNKSPEAEPSLLSPVFPEQFIYNNAQILDFFTIDKSPFFIIHTLSLDKHKYLWVDVRDKQIHIEDISDLLPQEPLKLWWEPGDDKNIFAFYPSSTNRIDIKAKAIYPDIAAKEIPLNKIKDPAPSGIERSIYNEDVGRWLDLTRNKIGLRNKNERSTQWIFQKGHNIQEAFWANNGSAILFKDTDQVFLMDAMPSGGHPRLQRIVDTSGDSSIHYSEKTGKLYFINPKNQRLSSVAILRHKPMLPKTIADTLRLKEFEP